MNTDSDREGLEEFAQRLDRALQRKPSLARNELIQTMVDAAAECVGAISAAFYDCDGAMESAGGLSRVAIAGLFPPLRAIGTNAAGADIGREKFATRAQLIEHVLRTEETLPRDSDNVVGLVAASGHGELIADARGDARLPSHADPTLTVRSIIFVPLLRDGRAIGVLALANPVSGDAFTSEDFSLAQSLAERAALALMR